VSSTVDQLRLAAALSHSAPDGDLELCGAGRRWLVSFRRPGATIDPCGFRRLVLATVRGCRVGLLPVEHLRFVGGLREIGGGVYESSGLDGPQRRIATFLGAGAVEGTLREAPDDGGSIIARVGGDRELGVSVVTLSTAHQGVDLLLDAVAQSVAAACMVEELIAPVAVEHG
jgi:hypothetical protein